MVMKKVKKKSILYIYLIIFFIVLLSACSPTQAPPLERIFKANDIAYTNNSFQVNKAAIWPENSVSACERIEQLAHEPVHKRSIFAFLASPFKFSISPSGQVEAFGNLNLAKSPLMQFVLTSPAVENRVKEVLAMSDEEFLKLARDRLRVDECEQQNPRTSECQQNLSQWQGALGKYRAGLLYQEKPRGVERELERKFAGVFGSASNMRLGKDESLFLSLLDRVELFKSDNKNSIIVEDAEAILTLDVPLFPKNRLWQDWLRDIEISLPAAIAGINEQSNPAERLCSLVLWQRVFAQLLMIKGYEGPKLTNDGRLPTLTENTNGIEKTMIYGAHINSKTKKALVLQPNEIANYAPSDDLYWEGSAQTPIPQDREKPIVGTLTDSLNRLESYVWIFAATSPAAPWTMNKKYYLGDLLETDTAIIPFQTHTLALGLILATLKNLGQNHIVPVDTLTDKVLSTGAGTGLVLLANGKHNASVGEMKLYDLIRLTTSLVRLEDSLEKIYQAAETDSALLEQRSLVYEKEENKIFPFYTKEKLQSLESLKTIIFRLKYPLAHRMIQMAESRNGCIAIEKANYETNGITTKSIVESCIPSLMEKYKDAMRILAHNTGSLLYYKKSL